MAESWGRSSKLARFYWREIGRTILDRFDAWSRTQGFDGWVKASKWPGTEMSRAKSNEKCSTR